MKDVDGSNKLSMVTGTNVNPPTIFYLFGSVLHNMLFGCLKDRRTFRAKRFSDKHEYSNVLPKNLRPLSLFCGETFQRPALARGHTQRTLSKEAP